MVDSPKKNMKRTRVARGQNHSKSILSTSPEVILLVGSHAAIGSWNIHDAVMLETSGGLSGIRYSMTGQTRSNISVLMILDWKSHANG